MSWSGFASGFGGFWKVVGKGLAKTGVGCITAAQWASQHPEVLQIITSVANNG